MAITEYVAKMDPATQHLHEEMVRQQSALDAEVRRVFLRPALCHHGFAT